MKFFVSHKKGLIIFGAMVLAIGFAILHAAQEKKAGGWNGILKSNVDNAGYVDYDQVRVNRGGDIYEYLSEVEVADLSKMTEKDKIAFWINAFNANVFKFILARMGDQPLSAEDPLYAEKAKVARWKLSLNGIRDRVLRSDPQKGGPVAELSIAQYNPLILFALCDGTVGGPNIRVGGFTGTNIDTELKECAVRFINNPKKVYVKDGKLHLSSLFDWYAKDFEMLGGVASVLKTFLNPSMRADTAEILAILPFFGPDTVVYEYNWTVNSAKNKAQ